MTDSDLILAIATSLGCPVPSNQSQQYQQWMQWIADAKLQVRSRLGDLDVLDQDILAYVVREAVVGKIRNPTGSTTREVAVDDGRVSTRFERATGQVSIWDEWWDMLTPDDRKSGAFSVRPTFQPDHRRCCP